MGEEESAIKRKKLSYYKIILFSFFILFACRSLAQSLDSSYADIAKFCILKYAVEKNITEDNSSHLIFLNKTINELDSVFKQNKFEYEISEIYNYEVFKFLNVVDLTNWQLHGFNKTIVAVNTQAFPYDNSVYWIDYDHPEKFINDILYNNPSSINRKKIVELYIKLKECGNIDITFFNGNSNREQFKYIENNTNILGDLLRYDRSGNEIFSLYKYNSRETVDYYFIRFSFNKDYIIIDESLLYRVSTGK